MKQFTYTITEPIGIHARPAGLLSREGKKYQSAIEVHKNGQGVNIGRLMALMGLGVQCGDTITVTVEGPDEDIAAPAMEAYFRQNL